MEYRERIKEYFDKEDLSYAAIYSLGLTILNLIDNQASLSIAKSIRNEDFDATNKTFESLIKEKTLYPATIFFTARMIIHEPYRRPSLVLLELILRNSLILVVKY